MMGIQAGENGERSDDRMADTILKGLSMKRKRGVDNFTGTVHRVEYHGAERGV